MVGYDFIMVHAALASNSLFETRAAADLQGFLTAMWSWAFEAALPS